jgi:peptidoglycan/LPS O-acetylase OafA/YrhL
MRTDATKLDQLTSLRFFAAMMIVILHSRTVFHYTVDYSLGQGVSFFYVLSGFILYFVYPKLETPAQVRRFLRARVARIWPAYVASFLLGLWLLSYPWNNATALAHLAMVQAWIPLPNFYYSYNAVAWSVSTEAFFYLAFPLLLWRWESTWKVKLLVTALPVVAMILLAPRLHLPVYVAPGTPEGNSVTLQGLLYNNPLTRIFEFALGMTVGLAWHRSKAQWSTATATALEVGTLVLCAGSLYVAFHVDTWFRGMGDAPRMWWGTSGGSALFFAALIHVMAQGRGVISRALTHRALVLLGEISFSIYLLHYILLDYIRAKGDLFHPVPDAVGFAIFLAVLLLASFLMWSLVEIPMRRLLLGQARIHGSTVLTRTWREHAGLDGRTLAAGTALAAIVALVHFTKTQPDAGVPVADAVARSATAAPASCNLETVNTTWLNQGVVRLPRGDVLIQGWVLSEASKRTGLPARLRLLGEQGGGAWDFTLTDWIARPQVLEVMHGVDAGNAGFKQRFDLQGLAPGSYRMAVAFTDGGIEYLCDKGTMLDLY